MATAGAQTVTWRLYSDANCQTLVSSVVGGFQNPHTKPFTLNGANTGGTVTSDAYTPTLAGTYRWIATYNGDVNNAPVSGVCSDLAEQTTVTRATPNISTDASADFPIGSGALTDIAIVSNLQSPVTTAGAQTVTWRLYSDANCQTLVSSVVGGFQNPHTKPFTLNGANTGGTVTSDAYTPTLVGTYTWIATYNGDVNNAPVSGVCSDLPSRQRSRGQRRASRRTLRRTSRSARAP